MAYYHQNMLSIRSRTLLAHILAEVVLLNQTNESYREALANTPYFDCIALFRMLDRQEKGYICQKDLQEVIGTSHRKLLTYAFSWMDNLKAGQISRLEFATFLLPRDNLQLRELVAQRVEQPELVHSQIETILQQFGIFREMVLEIVRREMSIIELRRELLKNEDYSVRGAVMAIDADRHQWVCAQDIYKFMKNFGFDVNLKQVEKLVQLINFAADGKISQDQLQWTIQGFEGNSKSYLHKIKYSNKKVPPKKPVNFEDQFERYKSARKDDQKRLNPVEQTYRHLVNKFKQVEVQQRKVDKNLIVQSQIVIQNMKEQEKLERANAQKKKQLERQQRQKQILLRQTKHSLHNQIENLITKSALLQAQSERLIRLQKRASIYDDVAQINRTLNLDSIAPTFQVKNLRPPSFGKLQESFNPNALSRNRRVPMFHDYLNQLVPPPVSQKNYFPNSISLEEFSGRSSNLRSEGIRRHVQSSDLYLEAARGIQQKIRRERQVEKNIRLQFENGRYDKFATKNINSESIGNNRTVTEKTPGQIRQKSRPSEPVLLNSREFGITNIQKEESDIIKSEFGSRKQPSRLAQVERYLSYGTPEHQSGRSQIRKFDLSTTNKMQA